MTMWYRFQAGLLRCSRGVRRLVAIWLAVLCVAASAHGAQAPAQPLAPGCVEDAQGLEQTRVEMARVLEARSTLKTHPPDAALCVSACPGH